MSEREQYSRNIVITGDVTMDWNIAHPQKLREKPGWNADEVTHAYCQRGGAALLADLIEGIANDLSQKGMGNYSIYQTGIPRQSVHPGDQPFHHSYALWSLQKFSEKPGDRRENIWRVEEYLGLDKSKGFQDGSGISDCLKVAGDSDHPDLVVLDDAGLGFREQRFLWPKAILEPGSQPPWIILKQAYPIAQGELWKYLLEHFAERLIVVISVDDLRRSEVRISRELSWERTSQDLVWELLHKPKVSDLARCAHLVITFGADGAVLYSRKDGKAAGEADAAKFELFFDSKAIEGMWEESYPGGMIGFNSCMVSGVARQIMLNFQKPALHQGIQSGLSAIRNLHMEGYKPINGNIVFPVERIVAEIAKEQKPFAAVEIRKPMPILRSAEEAGKPGEEDFWTILRDQYSGSLDQVAEEVALQGPEVILQGVPLGQFGNLLTVDRREIESLNSLRTLVSEYYEKGQQKNPLSVAVFGTPGSGKSFGIKEMAMALLPGKIEILEANLSQFDSIAQLMNAFHRVRDIALGGKLPLVFWDEFDTPFDGKALGWLRYFLAPMQDGQFMEGQIAHPIGKALFVFAGGTSTCMEDFSGQTGDAFRAAKGPDFVSRLKGYVNILGPNPQPDKCRGQDSDPYYVIRRAILVRSLLKRHYPKLFEKKNNVEMLHTDKGVLRAFLQIPSFRHGARSIEAVITMSLLTGKSSFERSSLPAEDQLDLHVDGSFFMYLVQEMELEGALLEMLAEAAHLIYCKGRQDKGYSYGKEKNEALKLDSDLVDYKDLPEEKKEQNRANVRDITNKLTRLGYMMKPIHGHAGLYQFSKAELDQLAMLEHERWMAAKLKKGWKYGESTSEENMTNLSLTAWADLPDSEKDKDLDLVRGIPDILAQAGYTISPSRRENGHGR